MAAAGVDDKIDMVLIILIHFDEVVAGAQGACGKAGFFQIDVVPAVQLAKVKVLHQPVGCFPHGKTGRNFFPNNGVQLLEIPYFSRYLRHGHVAAGVDAHKSRQNRVRDGHGEADRADFPRMNVRHDADSCVFCSRIVADHLKLREGIVFNCVCFCSENSSGCVCSVDCHSSHIFLLYLNISGYRNHAGYTAALEM